jgi:ketol-acid reductoisomerase
MKNMYNNVKSKNKAPNCVQKNIKKVLEQIQSGEFAREWIAENDEGLHRFKQMREQNKEHGVEKVGKELRSMMPWLESTT